jgi:hypothetical protein
LGYRRSRDTITHRPSSGLASVYERLRTHDMRELRDGTILDCLDPLYIDVTYKSAGQSILDGDPS